MSGKGVVDFIERALTDEYFLAQLKADPDKAMSEYDMTERERAAIKSGSEEEVKALGVDERLSKFAGISFF